MSLTEKTSAIQRFLQIPADGIYGPKTADAILLKLGIPAGPQLPPHSPPAILEGFETSNPVDSRSEKVIATLHKKVQPLARKLVRLSAEQGITIKLTSGTRTYAEQDALYEQGRTKPGKIVTNAKGGQSNHNFGVAFDFTIFNGAAPVWESSDYAVVGNIGKLLGLSWGGDWSRPDEPHFELHPDWANGMSESTMLAELRKRHNGGKDAFS